MRAALGETFRYPDPRGMILKLALAGQLDVGVERIALGNGSHELLMLLAQCFADAQCSIVFSQFGFAVFPFATAAAGARAICVPACPRSDRAAPLGHDLHAMAKAVRRDTRIVGTKFGSSGVHEERGIKGGWRLAQTGGASHGYAGTPP
jgi:histidinol-phosphate aminotransferase